MRRKIINETWEQIKTAYAAGINLREIAREMNIPEGTVLAHAKRQGWTKQIQVAMQQVTVTQAEASAPVQSVPRFARERAMHSAGATGIGMATLRGYL